MRPTLSLVICGCVSFCLLLCQEACQVPTLIVDGDKAMSELAAPPTVGKKDIILEREHLANDMAKGCIQACLVQLREEVRRLVMVQAEAGIAPHYDDLESLDAATKLEVQVEREYHKRIWRIVRMIENEQREVAKDTEMAVAELIRSSKGQRASEH